jgi:hypothetical protein
VFARGRPELFGVAVDAWPAIDVTEILWASLARFEDEEGRAARNNRRSFHKHADEFAWGLTVSPTARRQWEKPLIFLT